MPQLFGFKTTPLPGPSAFPGLGTAARFVSFLDDPIGTVLALRSHGEVAAVVADHPGIVCVWGPDRNREVLSNPELFLNPEDFFTGPPGSARSKMRAMVVTSNGEQHRRFRRLMMPAFQRSALDGYAVDIAELVGTLLATWPAGQVASLDDLCRELALCIAVKCFYGLDVSHEARSLGATMAEFVRIVTSPSNILLPLNVPGMPYRRGVQLGEALADRLLALVRQKRAAGGVQRDALGLFLSARDENGDGLTEDELMALAVELFIAGSETTSMTVTWSLLLLDQHPALLDEVGAELDGVLDGRVPTADDLPRLTCLDRVVKETMRLIPTAPVLFMRKAARDTTVGGFDIPRGANVVVSPLLTHHDERLYPRPRRFEPTRWLTHTPTAYAYLPFGGGPRVCTGALFAGQSVRLLLAMILQRFRPRVVEGARIDRLTRGNILHARSGVPMRLDPVGRGPAAAAVRFRGNLRELVELE
jgi:cytochrome P450